MGGGLDVLGMEHTSSDPVTLKDGSQGSSFLSVSVHVANLQG